jgi:hypothetical protein
MHNVFSLDLINRLIDLFKTKYNQDISEEEAIQYLHLFAEQTVTQIL